MIKNILAFAAIVCVTGTAIAQNSGYDVYTDLRETINDKLTVTMMVPPIDRDSIEFRMPKIVPGTYEINDFGRFISEFNAIAENGDTLPITRITENRILIGEANRLHKVTYQADDTWDSRKGKTVFEPAGTNFEPSQNFVLNTFTFLGYLEGMKEVPYRLHIAHQPEFFGATSLKETSRTDTLDVFYAENYVNLADAPLMYAKPDTASINLNGTEVLVSVYSPDGEQRADFVLDRVKEMLQAQVSFLGGKLPVDRYAFLIYLFSMPSYSGSYGALEHSYSSLYFLPLINNTEALASTITDISAHEFFHIVTPLNIHSEEIQYFDFINPEMSKHLWLYEGVTEYSAGLVQAKYGLMDRSDWLNWIAGKMRRSQQYNDSLPFTVMSKNVLDKYERQYGNVYEKGALIGLALDLKLLSLSEGTYDLQRLIRDLAKHYGKEKPFKDDELFSVIAEMTYPEINDFLERHVAGTEPLPLDELLAEAGVEFERGAVRQELTLGNLDLMPNGDTTRLAIASTSDMNEFGKDMGFEEGDVIMNFNGVDLTINNVIEAIDKFKSEVEPGDKVKVTVLREQNGKTKKKRLKAKARTIAVESDYLIQYMEDLTPEQQNIQNAWLNEATN
ncbi:peptidase M61 [Roseivirga sp. BDSF3-8]|uniref:M61 family metallopeptidase n=1 Tax=Roseivirga sp. BDSF3-8 TaxID=3241598 RepID=UPI003531A12E